MSSCWDFHFVDGSRPADNKMCKIILVDLKELRASNNIDHLSNLWQCLQEDGWLFILGKMRDFGSLGPDTFSRVVTVFVFG